MTSTYRTRKNPLLMTPRVTIKRKDFIAALKQLPRSQVRNYKNELRISFHEGNIRFRSYGIDIGMSAVGEWPGSATMYMGGVAGLKTVPPKIDPIIMEMEGDKLRIASSVFQCQWDPKVEGVEENYEGFALGLPMNPPFTQLVSIGLDLAPDVIERSGCKELIANAMDRKARLVIGACSALSPFGITRADIEALIANRLKGKTTQPKG